MTQCLRCHAENPPDAVFCCKCGKRLQNKSRESLSRVQWVVLGSLSLIVICVFGILLLTLASTTGQPQKVFVPATSTVVPTRGPTRTPVPTPRPTATLTPKQRMAAYSPIDPRDLAKSPERYVGQKIRVFGQVFDISESEGETFLQIMSCPAYEEYKGTYLLKTPRYCESAFEEHESLIVFYPGRADGLYNNHWVAVYGTVSGTIDGTNAFGVALTVPAIEADYLLFPLGQDDVVNTNW